MNLFSNMVIVFVSVRKSSIWGITVSQNGKGGMDLWRLYGLNSLLHHLHNKEVLPDVYLLCFSLCPLPLTLPLGTTEKSLDLPSLYPLFRFLQTLVRSPQNLLCAEQSQHPHSAAPCRIHVPIHHFCGPLLGSLIISHLSCNEEHRIGCSTSGVAE